MHHDELLFVLEALERLGYIAAVQGKGDDRWVMVCDPASAGLGPIIDALLIDRKQHGFNDNQALADAVCFCLTQKHAMALENALGDKTTRSEEHTSELQSLMRNSYAVFCLKKKKNKKIRR